MIGLNGVAICNIYDRHCCFPDIAIDNSSIVFWDRKLNYVLSGMLPTNIFLLESLLRG